MPIPALRRPVVAALAALAPALHAAPTAAQLTDEAKTARYMEQARENVPLLTAFLRDMPKGADLHSHLSGTVYAESYLRWGAEDGACIVARRRAMVNAPCTPSGDSVLPASAAMESMDLWNELVDTWSMRNWNAARENGHDQFFATFGLFSATDRRVGDMLAEAQARAAAGNAAYLELMQTADGRAARNLGRQVGWRPDFAKMRDTLLAAGLRDAVAQARANLTRIEARRDTVLGCGGVEKDPGCAVTVRWLYQVARANPPEQVFAQILLGFELAQADERVVGFNLVQPEDNRVAMDDFALHMRMIEFLRRLYPGVKVSLHAGELAPGLVPPEGLRASHVRQSVEVAGASRIGHGVDVMYETNPHELLREMARRGVMVEINLTSNDVILGVRGADHPLRTYLAYGVPVALSTDDEGVSRSELSQEYLKAAREQGLDYRTLKRMARTSLEHAFIRGGGLWRDARAFTPVAECAAGR